MRAGQVAIGLTAMLLAAATYAATPQDLKRAKAAAAAADRDVRAIDARAEATAEPGARARLQARAVAARVASAQAEIRVAQVRQDLVESLLAAQRGRLATDQGPVAALLATLTSLARRPAVLSIAQPGSVDDLVHTRAVLGVVLPAIRARTAELRNEMGRTSALRASAALAARSLEAGRARLIDAREALAAVDAGDGSGALSLSEEAREIVDQLQAVGSGQEVLAQLVRLPGPPVPAAAPPVRAAYRLPLPGRLVTGFGELSADGVRARGLTLAARAGAAVAAPAGGTIVYARPFRSYGNIVIIDHGAGWQSLVTGLGTLAVRRGDEVAAGGALGRARDGAAPQVMVELRRHGRPVDLAQLVG